MSVDVERQHNVGQGQNPAAPADVVGGPARGQEAQTALGREKGGHREGLEPGRVIGRHNEAAARHPLQPGDLEDKEAAEHPAQQAAQQPRHKPGSRYAQSTTSGPPSWRRPNPCGPPQG